VLVTALSAFGRKPAPGGSAGLAQLTDPSAAARELVETNVAAEPPTQRTRQAALTPGASSNGFASAEPILSRNAFDSVTGPLTGESFGIEDAEPLEPKGGKRYQAPVCKDASVTAIVASEDPSWSFAAIQTNDGDTQLRRIGDEVASYRVKHIGWYPNPPDARPRVWLDGGSARCQLDLDEEKKGVKKATRGSKNKLRKKVRSSRSRRRSSRVPKEILSKIEKVSDNTYELDRSVIDDLGDPVSDAWFEDGASPAALRGDVTRADYWDAPGKVVQLAKLGKAAVTGSAPDMGERGVGEP